MARIPEAVVATVKSIPLTPLVENYGVELTPHGDNAVGHCPFHKDDNPSFIVTVSKNLYHCFGCNAAGSPIDFIEGIERVGFRHAVEILREKYLSLAADTPLAACLPVKTATRINLSADDQTQVNEVVDYYHRHIEEAWPYLESRWLDCAELVRAHRLGFANRTLGYHLPDKQLKAGKEMRARFIELGILRESGHETFRGSLVIPIFDEAGNVTGIYGRKVTPRLREGTPVHLYLKGKHRGVWNWQGLVDAKEVILCEALIDALTFYRAGFHNVTSSYGVQGFTEDHLETFRRYGTRRVLIAYDRDEAGDTAARTLAARLTAEGISCARLEFPAGMDANEYALGLARAMKG